MNKTNLKIFKIFIFLKNIKKLFLYQFPK
ncbi:hypothetical protein BG0660 [Borreliella bavariensis PBi]|uniref:Uncharacterized protein n=1 Tax=Borrelia garinii subsp. bavariensis (strain ATCC BAA-2496 / DSM 23469 / PBi) TaxID=290434 RepID=A0A7I6GWR6_BORGP|nr:hypothetical protein BG0660 [Borreliella bavariensis PBi]